MVLFSRDGVCESTTRSRFRRRTTIEKKPNGVAEKRDFARKLRKKTNSFDEVLFFYSLVLEKNESQANRKGSGRHILFFTPAGG